MRNKTDKELKREIKILLVHKALLEKPEKEMPEIAIKCKRYCESIINKAGFWNNRTERAKSLSHIY